VTLCTWWSRFVRSNLAKNHHFTHQRAVWCSGRFDNAAIEGESMDGMKRISLLTLRTAAELALAAYFLYSSAREFRAPHFSLPDLHLLWQSLPEPLDCPMPRL